MTITHWHLLPWSYSCSPGNGAQAARHVWGKEDGVPQQTAFSRTPRIRRTARNGATGSLRAGVSVKWLPRARRGSVDSQPVQTSWTRRFCCVLRSFEGMNLLKYLNKCGMFCKVCERVISSLEESLYGKGKNLSTWAFFAFNHLTLKKRA